MSVTTISRREVTARKPHRCMCCEVVAIVPGERYEREVCAYDGRIYTWVSCVECVAIRSKVAEWAADADDGVGADDYLEWAHEFADTDPDAAAFLERRAEAVAA